MLDIQKHKFILVQILKDIFSDNEIGPTLGFKGGIAAYFFYDLPRFSVDLDFNLLDMSKEKIVLEKVSSIIEKYGKIKEVRKKRHTLFFLVSYKEEDQNVKVEISLRKFPDHYEVMDYLGIPMMVIKKEDMFAHKLVALLERKNIANRDLFDLWYFMKNNWQINRSLVELRTGMEFKKYLEKCISVIEKIDNTYILQGSGEILDEKQKKWMRGNLKKEVLFLLKYYLKES